QLRIHVGRLDRGKLLRYDSTDYGDFFEAAVEFMRGNSESAAKSMRNSAAWARKRQAARDKGEMMTARAPAWIDERDGQLCLVPERAAVVKRLYHLSAAGYGCVLIVGRLIEEGVPPFGDVKVNKGRSRSQFSGEWSRSYVAQVLQDRRAVGELQPRKPDGS